MLLFLRLGVIGGMLSLGALFSSQHLIFDLVSHFRIQYIVLIIAFLCLALYQKSISFTVILGVCLAVHTFAVYESQKITPFTAKGKTTTLTVMSSNLLASNDQYERHSNFIKSVDPDLIVFQEYTKPWDEFLSVSLAAYPYQLTVPINSPFGIAVYSKNPFLEENIIFLFDGSTPSVDVTISNEERKLRLLGTHPPPPISTDLYENRNLHLRNLSTLALAESTAMLIVGDLNISPWSDHFQNFLHKANLYDGRGGHGILPTWPASFFPMQIPIDHIVANSAVNVVSMNTSSGLDSDHRALWAKFEY